MTGCDYVAADGAWIRPEIFSDPVLYEAEQTRIFGRAWLLLGHVSQLPNSGSFLRTFMGEESVLVVRDRRGKIGAFLNVCRHRGFQVCQEDRGTAHRFQCRYHGWTYGTDGVLIGVPGEDSIYYREIDKQPLGLIPVARVEIYKGLVFGNFDPGAASLSEFLGDMAWYLDILLDRREGGVELLGPQRWRIGANWKAVAENHCGDQYHIGFAHGSVFGDLGPNRATPTPLSRQIRPGLGHGIGANIYPDEMRPEDWLSGAGGGPPAPPHVRDYLLSVYDEAVQRLGEARARVAPLHGAVWPNLGLVPVFNALRIIQPHGPNEVEMWTYCFVDRDAPADVKAFVALNCVRTFGPAGSFEQDDANNWAAMTRSSRGAEARKHRLDLRMGLGHEERSDRMPGELGLGASEINQRGFYRRWAEDMFGPTVEGAAA